MDRVLLPGFGGQYTSETFVDSDTAGDDTLDLSLIRDFSIQVNSSGITGTVDIEHTFDNTNWAVLIDNLSLVDGSVTRYDSTDGPFGKIRINPTDITAGTASLVITGFRDSE